MEYAYHVRAVINWKLYSILYFVFYLGTNLVHSQLTTSELYQDLFVNKNYTVDLIPICQHGGKVTVKLQTALRQVMDVVSTLSKNTDIMRYRETGDQGF